jgi:hypothetical protein
MNELEVKLRESQHEEKDRDGKILRIILMKISKTPLWARCIIILLLINMCVQHVSGHSKEQYESARAKRAFWKAAYEFKEGNTDGMNEALNAMAATKAFKKDRWRRRNLKYAEKNMPPEFVDAYQARVLLIESPGVKDAIDRMVKAQESDPEGWEQYAEDAVKEAAKSQTAKKGK